MLEFSVEHLRRPLLKGLPTHLRYQATLGPTMEVVQVIGHGIHASYGRNHPKCWIQQLEDNLPMLDVKLDPEG